MEEKVLEEVAYLNNEILRYEENPFDIMVTMRLFPLLIHMRATVSLQFSTSNVQ